MPTMLSKADLLARLKSATIAHGIDVHDDGDSALRGTREAIKAKWFLGSNKVIYAFSCRLDEATNTATFRESMTERSWGLAPPSFKMESYSQSGATVTSTIEQTSIGGGGTLTFGEWRAACETAVARAGWRFSHEALGVP